MAYTTNVPAPMVEIIDGKIESESAPDAKSVAVTSAMADDFARMENSSETRTQNTLANDEENAKMNAQRPKRVHPTLFAA